MTNTRLHTSVDHLVEHLMQAVLDAQAPERIGRQAAKKAVTKWLWEYLEEGMALGEAALPDMVAELVSDVRAKRAARDAHKAQKADSRAKMAMVAGMGAEDRRDFQVCVSYGDGVERGPRFNSYDAAYAYIQGRDDDGAYAILKPDGSFEEC